MEQLAEKMRKRNFSVLILETREEVAPVLMKNIFSGEKVGWGGSVSVEECEIINELEKRVDLVLLDRKKGRTPQEIIEIQTQCLVSDVFITSANAVLTDGRLVNIDGNGNRVAACIYPPKRVYFIVGENKIVHGGIEEAIDRIRKSACPKNAERLGRDLPCRLTGKCVDCKDDLRMCGTIVVHEWSRIKNNINVILVKENLGF
jgi:hypothetical protein